MDVAIPESVQYLAGMLYVPEQHMECLRAFVLLYIEYLDWILNFIKAEHSL
jgi:hypothetical protein